MLGRLLWSAVTWILSRLLSSAVTWILSRLLSSAQLRILLKSPSHNLNSKSYVKCYSGRSLNTFLRLWPSLASLVAAYSERKLRNKEHAFARTPCIFSFASIKRCGKAAKIFGRPVTKRTSLSYLANWWSTNWWYFSFLSSELMRIDGRRCLLGASRLMTGCPQKTASTISLNDSMYTLSRS